MAKKVLKPTKTVETVEQTQSTKFDASKAYEWKPDTKFTFDGKEFAFLYNTLMAERDKLVAQLQQIDLMQTKLINAVEDGRAVEKIEEAQTVE